MDDKWTEQDKTSETENRTEELLMKIQYGSLVTIFFIQSWLIDFLKLGEKKKLRPEFNSNKWFHELMTISIHVI